MLCLSLRQNGPIRIGLRFSSRKKITGCKPLLQGRSPSPSAGSGTVEIVAGDLEIVSRARTAAATGRRAAQSGPRGDGRCAASRHVARRPRGAAGTAAGTADRTRCIADPHARAVELLAPPRSHPAALASSGWPIPKRRNNVGVGLSIAIHVALVVLLALVLRVPAPNTSRGTD